MHSARQGITAGVVVLLMLAACGTRVHPSEPLSQVRGAAPVAGGETAEGTPIESSASATDVNRAPGGSGVVSRSAPAAAAPTRAEPTATAATPAPTGPPAPPQGPLPQPAVPRTPVEAKADLVIGSVGTLSGPAGEMLKDGVQAVQVWAQWVNDRNGLGGHRVRLLVADDGADPARHRALVQDLVENRRVVAFVQNQEGFSGSSAADYPTRKRIPVINTESSQNYVYESPMYFPVAPSGDEYSLAVVASVADVALARRLTKVGIIACVEVPAVCENAAQVWSGDRGAKALGLEVVYQAQASFTQPDYTAECLKARNAGAEVVMLALDTNSITRLATSCNRQGYRPLYGYPSISARPSLHDDPALEGSVAGTHTFAWPADDNPARREFHDAFARYAPGVEVSGGTANGWVAAKAFEAAARNLPDVPTSEAVLEGLWSLNGNDLGGLTYPLRFTRGQLAPRVSCRSVVVAGQGRWVAPNGGSITCLPRGYGEH